MVLLDIIMLHIMFAALLYNVLAMNFYCHNINLRGLLYHLSEVKEKKKFKVTLCVYKLTLYHSRHSMGQSLILFHKVVNLLTDGKR